VEIANQKFKFGLVIEKFYQTKPTFTRPKKIDKSQRYLQNVNNFVLVVFDQLIPVIPNWQTERHLSSAEDNTNMSYYHLCRIRSQ
jgi:hypothetical protein